MSGAQVMLLIVMLLGGIGVIGSYAQGFIAHPGSINVLWGKIHGPFRTVYFISMLLSALGYFAFAYFLLFGVKSADVKIGSSLGFEAFFAAVSGMLLFSSLWMPFVYSWVEKPNPGTWKMIRAVLFLVALSSCGLVWALLSLQTKEPSFPYWLAVAGAGYFAFHTTMLDAFIWPVLYK
jgi:hypothetical protein